MRSFGTKRILSLLLAVCMLATMLPSTLFSASAAVGTVYSYKFWDAMTALGATGTSSAFSTDYSASQDANVGSAKWMLVSTSNGYFAVSDEPYRIFTYSIKGGSDTITWKINVPEDGVYDATWNFYQYNASAASNVYLTPVGESETFLMTIDKTDTVGDRAVTKNSVTLAAGDYYLTTKQIATYSGDEASRYFCPNSFELTKVGEYDVEQVNFEYNFTKGFRGGYSTDVVAIENMGYPQTTKGSASEVQFADGARYISTDPWAFEGFLSEGSSANVTASFPIGATATTIDCRGYQIASSDNGGVSFRINVPKGGTYLLGAEIAKGPNYGAGTFYLAPATTSDPTASEYALGSEVSFNSSALADHTVLEFGQKTLAAGEYIVSVKGVINVLFWRNFTLTDPYYVSKVAFPRDSLTIAVGQTVTIPASVSPSTALQDVTYTSDDSCVSVDASTGAITGVSEGTATITATSDADDTKSDTFTVKVGTSFYYDFMKTGAFGITPSNSAVLDSVAYANDFKYTTAGSPDEVGISYESNGWKIGENVNSTGWIWSPSAVSLGLYVNVNSAGAESGTAALHLDVPVAGTYDLISVHSLWTGGSSADYYFAPVSAAGKTDTKYKVNSSPVNHKDSTNHTTEAVVGTVEVPTAGEYVLTFKSASASGIFLRGIRLSDATALVPVTSITLNKSGTVAIAEGETLAVTATVLPINASDKTYTLTSSDTSVAKIVDGAVVPVSVGFATITATANDGSGVKATFDVMCNMALKYTYEFKDTMATLYNASTRANVSASTNAFGVSYAKSEELGSDPWMYDTSNGAEYFDYTHSSYGGFGVFGMNHNTVGQWNSIKIKVSEGAKYIPMLRISDWAQSNSFDVYVAPVLAPDRVAAEYKVGSYSPSGSTVHGVQMRLDEADLPAGEYYVTFKITKVNGGTLIGLFDLELYKAGDLTDAGTKDVRVATSDGAQIRTTGAQGLRFLSSISSTADVSSVVEYGIIMIPTEYLNGDNENLVLGYKAGQKKLVGRVPAKYIHTETANGITYTAVLTDIPEANYATDISARAYAVYEDANGSLKVVYGDVVTRSIYTVAKAGLADASASADDKVVFQKIVDTVDNP